MSTSPLTRRGFLQNLGGISVVLASSKLRLAAASADPAQPETAGNSPWFRRALRWGQTNLAEIDPTRIDLDFWRAQWRRTALEGVVINAGGIVAYYPTKIPLHRRAQFLGERDLFGEMRRAADEEGLAVFARMDSNRADETFYRAHPDWFARDAKEEPYRVNGLFVACVNSPYYDDYIPSILREIALRYRPEGFTDNNWNGPMRDQPCFCARCEQKFRARTDHAIPQKADWDDPIYRAWILWNYERRLEIWDYFNQVTRDAGGAACLWVGMMAGNQSWQARVFRDDREIYARTEMVMLDDQRRSDAEGFPHNGEIGKRIRSVGGWDKIIPESMAMYQASEHNFRLATKPEPEVRLWFCEGVAGGVQPWWHHVGAVQPDRRMFQTAPPLWQWHRDNEAYLIDRKPIVSVGLVWSQRNMDFFGRDDAGPQVDDPWNGWTQALVRARLPYLPVHLDDLEKVSTEFGLRVLILPNLGAMSDPQAEALRRFVRAGGSLIATGLTSICDETGQARSDFALADVFGVHLQEAHPGRDPAARTTWAKGWSQTYLRVAPAAEPGHSPGSGEPGARHPIQRGFQDTDVIAFGGQVGPLRVDSGTSVLFTFLPAIPIAPPEAVWIKEPEIPLPALTVKDFAEGGRVVYLPADLDRRFARDNLPDHGDLLANLVRWAAKDEFPLRVEGPGLLDCHLYRQAHRLVLHLVNLTNAGTWRGPVHELIPVGPFQVSLPLPRGIEGQIVRSLVSSGPRQPLVQEGRLHFEVASILDHEVLVIE